MAARSRSRAQEVEQILIGVTRGVARASHVLVRRLRREQRAHQKTRQHTDLHEVFYGIT